MGKKAVGKSTLAQQIADLDDPTPKDFDPEDDFERAGATDDEDSSGEEEGNDGREHYEAVGKSKLRKPEQPLLGKQYEGSRVSRDALDADDSEDDPFGKSASEDDEEEEEEEEDESAGEFDDPDAIDVDIDADDGIDAEIDSDEAFDESDEERFKGYAFRASKINGGPAPRGDTSDEDEDEEEEDEDLEDDFEEGSDVSDDAEEEEDGDGESEEDDAEDDRAMLRKLMASDQKTVAATISQATKADAAKGEAVKSQRTAFDALLNARIKLQKGLGAVDTISAPANDAEANSETIKSAESAAIALWSSLEDLRQSLAAAQSKDTTSKKRKRPAVTESTSSIELWQRMQDLEASSITHRRSILDKWSSKVRGAQAASLPSARGGLLKGASGQQAITSMLDGLVNNEASRIPKRAKTDTTLAPISYDDTAFYQLLLRDLVALRMSSTTSADPTSSLPSSILPSATSYKLNQPHSQKKKEIDTRASKGRKMRFTVHEKLQNFMPRVDEGSWSEAARIEFFASLLGGKGRLNEDETVEDTGSDAEEAGEEAVLRLFRN